MTTLPLRVAPALFLLLASGCGGGTTDVSGKVTFQGKPVVYGTVVMIGSDGIPKNGPIQPDGSYHISGVKTGPVKVAVSSPPPPGVTPPAAKGRDRQMDEGKPEAPPAMAAGPVNPDVVKHWFVLPEKFGDPAKSGVSVDVAAGQPVTIELK
jgi:hypothetical protein